MGDNTKQGLFAVIDKNPGDLCSWAALHDVLEAEGAPDEVLRVCRQAGTWIGSREDWEREGQQVVDRVLIARVWVLDISPSMRLRDDMKVWRFWKWEQRRSVIDEMDAEDIPSTWWIPSNDSRRVSFATAAEAQAWLTQIALEYARRVRDERKKEEASDE